MRSTYSMKKEKSLKKQKSMIKVKSLRKEKSSKHKALDNHFNAEPFVCDIPPDNGKPTHAEWLFRKKDRENAEYLETVGKKVKNA